MPNWNQNFVTFSGDEKNVKRVRTLFKRLQTRCEKLDQGVFPSSIIKGEPDRYFFNIYVGDNEDYIHYETKWSPNIPDLIKIADHYSLDFEYDYEELGCRIYGKAFYKNKILQDTYLDYPDFDKYVWNEEADNYSYEGVVWESESEILEDLLDKKIKENETRIT